MTLTHNPKRVRKEASNRVNPQRQHEETFMHELTIAAKVALFIFGVGGAVALAIVPWACIGTGLYNKNKKYQS
jgi:hypothetical protein